MFGLKEQPSRSFLSCPSPCDARGDRFSRLVEVNSNTLLVITSQQASGKASITGVTRLGQLCDVLILLRLVDTQQMYSFIGLLRYIRRVGKDMRNTTTAQRKRTVVPAI